MRKTRRCDRSAKLRATYAVLKNYKKKTAQKAIRDDSVSFEFLCFDMGVNLFRHSEFPALDYILRSRNSR